jgi:hypothetical protein
MRQKLTKERSLQMSMLSTPTTSGLTPEQRGATLITTDRTPVTIGALLGRPLVLAFSAEV